MISTEPEGLLRHSLGHQAFSLFGIYTLPGRVTISFWATISSNEKHNNTIAWHQSLKAPTP